MSDIVIRAEDLGKRYRLAPTRRETMIREAIVSGLARGARRIARLGRGEPEETFWALRDVSFEIARGEAVGIIGGNGAGKSTLLKLLSRITEPTTGSASIRGRVGSLLEVGTGFHPELSGRENIFLNGAVLGMKRHEVARKFDEIVAFAEVDRFIDTPVKHYSSGMYLRLAFAVAAHLEPEVLIVDEVLAVGDAAFQRKCLGRMEDVAGEGRTVIFVSHNMDAVRRLCTRCLMLDTGRIVEDAGAEAVVGRYLSRNMCATEPGRNIDFTAIQRGGGDVVRFEAASFTSGNSTVGGHAYPGGPLELLIHVYADQTRVVSSLAVTIRTTSGTLLINADVLSLGESIVLSQGRNVLKFRLKELWLNPGRYLVDLWAGDALEFVYDHVVDAFALDVIATSGGGPGVTPEDNGAVPCTFTVERHAAMAEPVSAVYR